MQRRRAGPGPGRRRRMSIALHRKT